MRDVLCNTSPLLYLHQVRPCLDQLQALGFRTAPEVRAGVLRLAGEG